MSAGRKVNTKSKDWGTPKKYVEPITEFFGGEIQLDPCSNEHSIVGAAKEILLPQNGLELDWDFQSIYVNPPYGRGIKNWIKKSYESFVKYGAEVILLIPVASNTSHWKEFIYGKAAVCFLYDTRLKFLEKGIENKKGAPMSCCLVYFGLRIEEFFQTFRRYGAVSKRFEV